MSRRQKLSPSQRHEIRSRFAQGETQSALARFFGVSQVAVFALVKRDAYNRIQACAHAKRLRRMRGETCIS